MLPMLDKKYATKADYLSFYEYGHVADDFVWATTEQARLRARSLYVIRSIVEKYGGTMETDPARNTIDIDVPEKRRIACVQEIEEKVGTPCL